jgi:hypothetical protein
MSVIMPSSATLKHQFHWAVSFELALRLFETVKSETVRQVENESGDELLQFKVCWQIDADHPPFDIAIDSNLVRTCGPAIAFTTCLAF